MGNNFSNEWREAVTNFNEQNMIRDEEEIEIWEMLMRDYGRMTKYMGHEFHAQNSKIESMLESHFRKMEEGVMKKINMWADHETDFWKLQKSVVEQTSNEITKWNASLLSWGEFLDSVRAAKSKRSKRNAIDDIVDNIHTTSYLNFSDPKYGTFKCEQAPTKPSRASYNYEITAGTGCFIIIIAFLILLLTKIQKLTKEIEGKSIKILDNIYGTRC